MRDCVWERGGANKGRRVTHKQKMNTPRDGGVSVWNVLWAEQGRGDLDARIKTGTSIPGGDGSSRRGLS